jgi:hypothetical protein
MPTLDLSLIRKKYQSALEQLAANVRPVCNFDRPVLTEGGIYQGIWLECGPMEGLIYRRHAPEIADANHEIFFHLQREDGYLPCYIKAAEIGISQIQMVVPIAATALETAALNHDEGFLLRAYNACARWDGWLKKYRNTRGTGLCELFCEWDSGHDNSPRLANLPLRCVDDDARFCPDAGKLPYLAPDLSASVYGGRVALAKMAKLLGKDGEADHWQEEAEKIQIALMRHCFDPEDECFYDVDRDGKFVKIRGDVLTRVFSEHVVDQKTFDAIYYRHLRDPEAFWTPYPFPSIATNDPAFIGSFPENSWGGASQALTALRAPRWMSHYGKEEDLNHLMNRWIEAILRAPAFMQQMNPWTGEFNTSPSYSPAMLVFTSFVERLFPELDSAGYEFSSGAAKPR